LKAQSTFVKGSNCIALDTKFSELHKLWRERMLEIDEIMSQKKKKISLIFCFILCSTVWKEQKK